MKQLSYIINYYNQLEALKMHFRYWNTYSIHALDQVEFVVIDDGASIDAVDAMRDFWQSGIKFDLAIYKIKEDVPYNFPGTLNLGATVANAPVIMHTDLDVIAKAEDMDVLLKVAKKAKSNQCYKLKAMYGKGINTSLSSFLLWRETFWKVGGYDEDFAGNYGHDDIYFNYKMKELGYEMIELEDCTLSTAPEGITNMNRDTTVNDELMEAKKKNLSTVANVLRFSWERVY